MVTMRTPPLAAANTRSTSANSGDRKADGSCAPQRIGDSHGPSR